MSIENWKTLFEWGGAALLGLTFIFGVGLVVTSRKINAAEAERARQVGVQLAAQQERAAKAEKDLRELQEKNRPRVLTQGQQDRITERLRPFAGREFDIAILTEPEPQDLLTSIENLLARAGWVQVGWRSATGDAQIVFTRPNKPAVGIVPLSGLIIQMHPERVAEFSPAARELAAALNAEGIPANAEGGLGVPNTNSEALHILIGKKQ